MKKTSQPHLLPTTALAVLLISSTQAANLWDGGGADNNWNTALNWDNNLVPTFPVALSFGGTTRLTSNNNLTSITANGITFNSGAGAFTLTGNALTLAGGLTNSSTNLQTINLALALGTATRTVTVGSGGGNLTLGQVSSGTIALTGSGILTLQGSTDNSGLAATVASGTTLVLNKASSATVHAVGANGLGLTVSSGGTVQLSGSGGDQIYINTDVSLAGTFDLNGRSEGFDGLNGAGIVTNNAASTTGTLTLGQFNDATASFTGTIQDGASGRIVALSKTGTGTQILGGANTYTGGTVIGGGILQLSGSGTLGSSSGALTVNTGGTLNLNGTTQGVGNLTGTGGTIVNNATATNIVFTIGNGNATGGNFLGALDDNTTGTGTLALTKTGTGTIALGGTNTYTGITTVGAGVLQFGKQVALYNNTLASWTATNLIIESGATMAFNVGGTGEFTAADITALGALGTATGGFRNGSFIGLDTTNASGGSFSYGGILADTDGGNNALGLAKFGTNALAISGANTYTGGTIANNGTINVSGDQSAANGGWSLLGRTAAGLNNTAATVNFETGSQVAVAGGKTIQLGNNTAAGGFAAQTLNVAGSVNNAGTLQVGRSGMLNINNGGAWTQTGNAVVATQGGGAAAMTVNTGGFFIYTNAATPFQLNTSTSTGTVTGLNLNGGVFTTNAAIRNNTGTVATNTSSIVTLNNGGTLRLSGNVASLATTAGATFSFQVGSTGSGGIIDTNGYNTALDRAIGNVSAQAGKLTKTGDGTLTLTGPLSYTGSTTVNGGTLAINTTLTTSDITVNAGGTLAGTGTLGNVAIGANGTIAPGLSPGTLAMSGLGLDAISTIAMELDPLNLTLGGGINDLLSISGLLQLDGILNVTAASGSFTGVTSGTWTLFTYGSLVDNGLSFGSMPNLDAGYSWQGNAGDTAYTLTIVPEPAAAFLGSIGLLALLRRRR